MKNLIFLLSFLFVFTGNVFGQDHNYWVKTYNVNAPNRPRISYPDSTRKIGKHVIADTLLLAEVNCYMDLFNINAQGNMSSIYDDRGTILNGVLTPNGSVRELGNFVCVIHIDASKKPYIEQIRVKYNIPGFGYVFFFRNTEISTMQQTLQMLIVSKNHGNARYNLTTGQCLIGSLQCWSEFTKVGGFMYLKDSLAGWIENSTKI